MLLFVAGVISTNKETYSLRTLETQDQKIEFFRPVIQKLIEKGVPEDYVLNLLRDTSVQFNERYVQVDVSLSRPSKSTSSSKIYDKLVNDEAVNRIINFINTNQFILNKIQNLYSIDPEVLASLLWVETRHGDYLGNHQIVSVYFSLALADTDNFIEYNLKRNKDKLKPTKKEIGQLKNKLVQKSRSKANWAINELVSIYKNQNKFPLPVTQIYGSWAGAFGISQFIPSSFVRWAVDGNNDGLFNLFDVEDAIFSAANYLAKHGYGPTEEQKRKALYAYNHSNTYVNTIMLLANKANEKMNQTLIEQVTFPPIGQ